MKSESLGKYIQDGTGKIFEVKRFTEQIKAPNGVMLDGSYGFKTADGIDLQSLEDDLTVFELIQIDGIIRKKA